MRILLFILVTLAFMTAHLTGQGNENVRTEFRVIPILSADWTGIFYRPTPSSDLSELKFQSLARSFSSYNYQGPNPLIFYRKDGIDENGKPLYKPVGNLKIVSSELVVFFMSNLAIGRNSSNLEFTLIGLDDSPSALPVDHVSFLNLTGTQLGCRFMDEDLILENGFNEAISLGESVDEAIFVGMLVMNENSHRVVLKNNWRFNKGNRHIIMLLPPKKAGSYRIRAYRISEYVGENPRFRSSF